MIIGNKRFQKSIFASVFLSFLLFSINLLAQKTERTNWQIPNDSTLILFYNNPVIAPSQQNYSLGWFVDQGKRPSQIKQSADQKQIILIYASKFPPGVETIFMINNVQDKASKEYLPLDYFQVVYTPSRYDSPYRYGDIVITELMFRPSATSSLLPNAEYFELLNTTDKTIDLRGWRFYRGTIPFGSTLSTLKPGAYAIAVSRSKAPLFPSTVSTIPFDGFPVLRNECDTFAVYDPSNKLIAAVEYHDSWLRGATSGVSIEAIDPTNHSDRSDNWLPSLDPSGGTPGRINSVCREYPDLVRPTVKEIYYPFDRQLRILFSNSMDADSLIVAQRYRLSDPSLSVVSVQPILPMCREVIVHLSDPLLPQQECRLNLQSLPSRSGRMLLFPHQEYPLYCPEMPQRGDVLINELLNDPPVADADYLELYNLSSRPLDLSQLYLFSNPVSGKPPVPIPISQLRRAFPPHSYLLLSKRPHEIIEHYQPPDTTNYLLLSKMPTLYNDGGDIFLTTTNDTLDYFVFHKKLHSSDLREVKGVSLERVSMNVSASRADNWRSGSASTHYGTPGYRNSAAHSDNLSSDSSFEFPRQTFSPNYDGRDDELPIHYRFTENTMLTVEVLTRTGIRVALPIDRELLVGEGVLSWNGQDLVGKLLPAGIYILEIFGQTNSGRSLKARKTVVITLH